MIDAHLHVVPPALPGAGPLNPLLDRPIAERAAALQAETTAAGITRALAMGSLNLSVDDPLGVAETLAVAAHHPGLFAIGVADPLRTDPDHLRRVDRALSAGLVKALKVYLGYVPFPPDHVGYRPYYELAEKHQLPVFFHTGDTYSPRARLRHARPILVDDVAVDHPKVRFILAHCGNPWLIDAAEVVYKNINVWADLSGLALASTVFPEAEQQEYLDQLRRDVRRAFLYAERPNRFLYGSDWPLVSMVEYRDFIRSIVPEICHEQVFEENARTLFKI